MKKTLLLSSMLILISVFSFCQMNTGSFFATGTTGLNLEAYSGKNVDSDTKTGYLDFSFQPKVGYFLKNRIALGAGIMSGLERSSTDEPNFESTNTTSSLVLGPFGRYYYEYGSFIPFADAFIGFGRQNSKYKSGDLTTNTPHSIFKVAAGVGSDYFINETVAIEGLLQYFWEKQKPSGDNSDGGGHNYSGLMLSLGILVYFGTI